MNLHKYVGDFEGLAHELSDEHASGLRLVAGLVMRRTKLRNMAEAFPDAPILPALIEELDKMIALGNSFNELARDADGLTCLIIAEDREDAAIAG